MVEVRTDPVILLGRAGVDVRRLCLCNSANIACIVFTLGTSALQILVVTRLVSDALIPQSCQTFVLLQMHHHQKTCTARLSIAALLSVVGRFSSFSYAGNNVGARRMRALLLQLTLPQQIVLNTKNDILRAVSTWKMGEESSGGLCRMFSGG